MGLMSAWRKKKVNVLAPEWTDENTEAYLWCINNGIKISPWAASNAQDNYYWWIDVEVNGAKKRSPFKYHGKQLNEKIFLETDYNTVHAFKKKGYLKEISINSDKSYFDTNITNHHHFFDEDTNELIDCDDQVIETPNIKKNITGKKINSVEVLIKVATDNQNQK